MPFHPVRAHKRPGISVGRERETTWIRKHGPGYRGQWVAVSGDRLIAVGGTLKALLADIEAKNSGGGMPLIQYIVED